MNINRTSRLSLAVFALCFLIGLLSPSHAGAAPAERRADFRGETVSVDAQHVADWVVHSGDAKGLPFIIVDKVNARAIAFDRTGKLLRSTPVLTGMGVGDAFEPGVLTMNMYNTKPSQRITPAGRYVAEEDRNLAGERVLWVDYDAGIALHKMPAKRTKQRRQERMRSSDPAEHRITYGCINVPPAFYDQVVHPHFKARGGVVYVLPDTAPLKAVFKSYDVGERDASLAQQAGAEVDPVQTQF